MLRLTLRSLPNSAPFACSNRVAIRLPCRLTSSFAVGHWLHHIRRGSTRAGCESAHFYDLASVVGTSLNYCWKLLADGLGQRRAAVVVLGVNPPARKVQHSPSVEQ
jgi:hypothetical protein